MEEGKKPEEMPQAAGNGQDFFKAAAETTAQPTITMVEWRASEFIDHQKSIVWFVLLGGATLLVAILVFFLNDREVIGPVIILFLGLVFGLGAARKPRVLDYSLDESGLNIGERHFPYEEFRSFAIVDEGSVESILLLPTKRWVPALSVYYAPDDGDKITEALGSFVPLETHKPGITDSFLNKIRF